MFSCQKHLKNQHTTEKPANSSCQEEHRIRQFPVQLLRLGKNICGHYITLFQGNCFIKTFGLCSAVFLLHRWRFGDAAVTDIRCEVRTLLFSKIKLNVALNNLLKCILNPLTKRAEHCLLTLSVLKPQRNLNEKDLGDILHQTNTHTQLYPTVFRKTYYRV